MKLLLALAILPSALAAPDPFDAVSSSLSTTCRPCIRSTYDTCGGGYASVNQMIGCICTTSTQSTLGTCASKSCTSDEAAKIEDARSQYCNRYTTTGSWTEKGTTATSASTKSSATAGSITGSSATVTSTAAADGVSVGWKEVVAGIGGVLAMV